MNSITRSKHATDKTRVTTCLLALSGLLASALLQGCGTKDEDPEAAQAAEQVASKRYTHAVQYTLMSYKNTDTSVMGPDPTVAGADSSTDESPEASDSDPSRTGEISRAPADAVASSSAPATSAPLAVVSSAQDAATVATVSSAPASSAPDPAQIHTVDPSKISYWYVLAVTVTRHDSQAGLGDSNSGISQAYYYKSASPVADISKVTMIKAGDDMPKNIQDILSSADPIDSTVIAELSAPAAVRKDVEGELTMMRKAEMHIVATELAKN